jgi:hypothetical protein
MQAFDACPQPCENMTAAFSSVTQTPQAIGIPTASHARATSQTGVTLAEAARASARTALDAPAASSSASCARVM